jgi:hypothetical protein
MRPSKPAAPDVRARGRRRADLLVDAALRPRRRDRVDDRAVLPLPAAVAQAVRVQRVRHERRVDVLLDQQLRHVPALDLDRAVGAHLHLVDQPAARLREVPGVERVGDRQGVAAVALVGAQEGVGREHVGPLHARGRPPPRHELRAAHAPCEGPRLAEDRRPRRAREGVREHLLVVEDDRALGRVLVEAPGHGDALDVGHLGLDLAPVDPLEPAHRALLVGARVLLEVEEPVLLDGHAAVRRRALANEGPAHVPRVPDRGEALVPQGQFTTVTLIV